MLQGGASLRAKISIVSADAGKTKADKPHHRPTISMPELHPFHSKSVESGVLSPPQAPRGRQNLFEALLWLRDEALPWAVSASEGF